MIFSKHSFTEPIKQLSLREKRFPRFTTQVIVLEVTAQSQNCIEYIPNI